MLNLGCLHISEVKEYGNYNYYGLNTKDLKGRMIQVKFDKN